MPWGQESSLPSLLGTREGRRPLALPPYTVPRQTFGLEMSVCAGHMRRRCTFRVQLKGKEAELRVLLCPSSVALLLGGRAALVRRCRSISPAKQKSITAQHILQLNESNSLGQGKLSWRGYWERCVRQLVILAVCPVPAQTEEGADSKHAVKKQNVSSSHGRSIYYQSVLFC